MTGTATGHRSIPNPAPAAALWSGRFSEDGAGGDDALFRAVNDSLPVDWRMVQQDIAGSIAWVRALRRAEVLTREEADALVGELGTLTDEAAALPGPPVDSGAEDVHTWVEQRLTERLGTVGKKLHTGRSRNDQVATDLRLWIKDAAPGLIELVRGVQRGLVEQAGVHTTTPFPGYTHLQRAQPVTFGHWCLAYTEMLERDAARIASGVALADECPLGCGALAGTAYAIDREELAKDLGFARASANSLDAISDRDVVADMLGAIALLGVHLSRLAEDLVCYASGEFALVECDDGVSSGSSLMPQKKNPDALELVRGKAGRLIGLQAGMLVTLKGTPLSYNKDLQEDKSTLFAAWDEAGLVLRIAARIVEGLSVDRARALAAAQGGYANATDLADELVNAGVPFRSAHERVGSLVRVAIDRGVPLEELPADVYAEAMPELGPGVASRLTVDASLARRAAVGGTSPVRVAEQATAWRERLGMHAEGLGG
ncbi:MAG: argininosuccinate lyase [Planctomycetota bacterium]